MKMVIVATVAILVICIIYERIDQTYCMIITAPSISIPIIITISSAFAVTILYHGRLSMKFTCCNGREWSKSR